MTIYIDFPKYIPPTHFDFYTYDDYFSEQELIHITKYCSCQNLGEGMIGGSINGIVDNSVRKSNVNFLEVNSNTEWIYKKLFSLIAKINHEVWGFNLTKSEFIQYSEYFESGDHYDWHVDKGFNDQDPSIVRKLSMAMMLNSDEEFCGGEFEIDTSQPHKIEHKLGRIVIFPSYVKHRVCPVIKGVRKSLVLWVSGPTFI